MLYPTEENNNLILAAHSGDCPVCYFENLHKLNLGDIAYLNYKNIEYLQSKKAKSIKICTLINKPERREVEVDVDYIGFDIPNKFVLGYGLDYEGYYRNLPYIGYIEV